MSDEKHNLDTHLVTTVATNIITPPSIENIIEEEEEDEEDERYNQIGKNLEKESEAKVATHITLLSNSSCENPKFTLEIVNENDFTNKKQNESPIKSFSSKPDNLEEVNEIVEIKVEEGYATRQMDEYFRQTIAAIKEELTKKLENKNDQNQALNNNMHKHHHRNHFHYSNETEENYSDSDYDDDDLNDNFNETQNESNFEEFDQTTNFKAECECCEGSKNTNRNLLYQHLISLTNKKPSKTDKIITYLVLFGCFLNQFLIDGFCFNYGSLYKLIQKEFKDTSNLITLLPGTFLFTFYLLLAPVSLFLTKQYGPRRVSIVGTLITTVSLFICYFSNNFIAFTIFFGIFTGIGTSLIYIPSVIATSKWFLKKRLFANSLTVLGGCLGAGLYPLITEFILSNYDLHNTFLILSGIQFNCLIGSLLLREHKTQFSISFKNKMSKKKLQVSKFMKQNDNMNVNLNKMNKLNKKKTKTDDINRRRLLSGDSETESTISTSTMPNYTLKQYWRKFVQTRKSQSNNKKNLFHLIAEEKRKRTLSKTSLEDGFVITTSNNLLAPNDESHVIVSREAKLAIIQQQMQNNQTTSSKQTASRFLSRIANSLRSLAHANTSSSSPINTSIHSKINLPTQGNIQEVDESEKNKTNIIPLMNVFNAPIPQEQIIEQSNNNNNDLTNLNQISEINVNNSDSDEEDFTPTSNYFQNNLNKINAGFKNSRYLSYRNSLTNSVRGSLMECSVPEDKEENETDLNSGVDGNNSFTDEDDLRRTKSQRQPRRKSNFSNQRSTNLNCKNNRFIITNANLIEPNLNENISNTNNNKNAINNLEKRLEISQNGVGYLLPSLLNLRRFLSTIEASSFLNLPINLETIEYNLKNSLIKKCSDNYRKRLRLNRNNLDYSKSTLFLDYLSYLSSHRLLKNKLLFLINFSFMFNLIGFNTILFFLCEYCQKFNLNKMQSTNVLCLTGFMCGIGRLISTISYKVNDSNSKSRIFSFILTLFLIGALILISVALCDTFFSFSMFAIAFGILMGFNFNLRSLFIYDLLGLEWSDDSLFFYSVFIQSIGITIGLPLAGFIYDIYGDIVYVLYFSSFCFIISGLILTPGRRLKIYCKESFKSINKFYLQKRL